MEKERGKINSLLRGFPPFLRWEAATGMFMFYSYLDLLMNVNLLLYHQWLLNWITIITVAMMNYIKMYSNDGELLSRVAVGYLFLSISWSEKCPLAHRAFAYLWYWKNHPDGKCQVHVHKSFLSNVCQTCQLLLDMRVQQRKCQRSEARTIPYWKNEIKSAA